MVIGAARVELHVHGSQSLKQKRGVVRAISQRLRNRFNVAGRIRRTSMNFECCATSDVTLAIVRFGYRRRSRISAASRLPIRVRRGDTARLELFPRRFHLR